MRQNVLDPIRVKDHLCLGHPVLLKFSHYAIIEFYTKSGGDETTLPQCDGVASITASLRVTMKRSNRNGVEVLPKTALKELAAKLRREQQAMVSLLREFIEIESFSDDKPGVDRFAERLAAEWQNRGASVQRISERRHGDHVRAELWAGEGRPSGQILVLGHMDTVYPPDTIEKTPFRIARGFAYGPGTFDMKGGLVIALFALDALRELQPKMQRKLVFLWTSDEEIGSTTSRQRIEQEARKSDAVLVLEPAFGADGRLKTQRKGVGELELHVTGKAAHAGINPEKGVNAVHELALQIERLLTLNDRQRGITVQTNVISGGTASNVVAADAHAKVDIRFVRARDAAPLQRKLHSLRPILKGARVEISGGINRPPLERTAGVESLFRHAQALAKGIGFHLGEAATGGGSDGNFTAALGIPTLDGLGAVGEGAHSPEERVLIRALPQRAALVAALLATL